MSPSDASCTNNFGMSIDMLLLEIDSPAPFNMTVIIQRIREAIESIQPRDFSLVHDWVDEALRHAELPFQRALETAYGTIDFLVESVVVQVEAADGRGPEEFRRLGVLLECHGYPSGVLLTSRYRRPFETEWHTREAVSLPVQILPIQTVRR